jgi:peptidoglycan/xylan/chitin deacetylase (PgdA/CDA1 family)
MKNNLKTFLKFFLGLIAAVILFSLYLDSQYTVPIMMYHHVQNLDYDEPNWVSVKNFAYQMAYLHNYHYKILTLSQLVDLTKKKQPLPRHAVVVTFDDGAEDVFQNAFPVLQEYKIPATLFIPSGFINQPGSLTLDQIKTMMRSGLIEVGSHGALHNYLPDLPPDRQKYEVVEGKRLLEEQIGQPVRLFAYPIGGFTDQIKKMVKDAGFEGACTTNRGHARLNQDVYELKRIRFGNRNDTGAELAGKLSGFYNVWRKSKNPY